MSVVFLGLGSNVGDRQKHLEKAVIEISKFALVEDLSSVYETAAWGNIHQDKFLNQCLKIKTDENPLSLLKGLKKIEKHIGRVTREKWGPREIDIDILLYDNDIIDSNLLVIPHPYLHERAFVLVPLCEIAAHIVHPVLQKTIDDLSKKVNPKGIDQYSLA